jgi:hypothetical protein
MVAEKVDQAMGGRDVGTNGMLGATAVTGKMVAPAKDERPGAISL